jgi:hypothetical protein
MLSRIPQDRRTALLRCISERLHELEAMDRSLARLGEGFDPGDTLLEIVVILDKANPRARQTPTA